MAKVVMIGGGGHAKVVADLLRASGHEIVGCTDPSGRTGLVNGVEVLGHESDVLPRLFEEGIRHAFVALGDNKLRRRVAANVAAMGFEFVNAIGRSAVISGSASLGFGCAVMEGAVINSEARIGSFAIINTNASIDHDCVIGDYAHVAPGSAVAGAVEIGEGSFLGAGTRVIPGVKVCPDAIIGAGGVVIRDVLAAGTWVGVPARKIKVKD